MTSSCEGLVHGSVEPVKPDQKLIQSSDSRNSSSHQPTSERTLAASSIGTSDPHLKETSNKNTDSAVVDSEIKPSNGNSDSTVLTDDLADTSIDLDEQSIMTYVFQ